MASYMCDAVMKLGDTEYEKVTFATMVSVVDGESPHTFFSAREKPTLSLCKSSQDLDTDEGWKNYSISIWHHLSNDNLNVEWVKLFLYQFFKNETEICSEPWISYQITISTTNNEVHTATPWSTLNIITTNQNLPAGLTTIPEKTAPPNLGEKLATALIGINRLIRANNADYRESLELHLRSRVGLPTITSNSATDMMSFTLAASTYASWLQDPGYCKMMAAVDMFYHKFKKGAYASVRWGSVSCRDKDLGAMLALEDLRLQTESSLVTETLTWVWLESVGRELRKLMDTHPDLPEAIKRDSYFHYQSDMGAVSSSKYASVHNKKLYTLTHMVGTLLNQKRSYNAYLIEHNNVHSLYKNAVFIAYACKSSHNLAPVGAPSTKEDILKNVLKLPSEEGDSSAQGEIDEGEPKVRDGLEWFAYWRGLEFKETNKLKKWVNHTIGLITQPRDGTIGQWVQQNGALLIDEEE